MNIDYYIKEAVEYINTVTIKQARLLSKQDLYDAYKATVNHFNQEGFNFCYDSYKDILRDRGII